MNSLFGRVFHVTHLENLESIATAGCINPAPSGAFKSTFGHRSNGFFRNRGCISLFDYRGHGTPDFEENWYKCHPFSAARPPSAGVAVLFLDSAKYDQLLPWTLWRDAAANREIVVPHIEVGYEGALALDHIVDGFSLVLEEDPSSFLAAFRRARAHVG